VIITNGKIGVEKKHKITFSTCREKSAFYRQIKVPKISLDKRLSR
jgi:hypothetical protein